MTYGRGNTLRSRSVGAGQRNAAAARRRRRNDMGRLKERQYVPITGRERPRVGFYLTVLGLILALVLMGALILCFLTSFLNISEFYTPNEGRYSADVLAQAGGLELGVKIYSADIEEAERRILDTYPEIGSVKITRELPDRIAIAPVYATAKYFVSIYGEYYTLSDELRVLERVEDRGYCTALRLVELEPPEIKRAVTGEILTFADSTSAEYVERMLTAVSGSELYGLIDRLGVKSKFDCYALKRDSFKISFGECKDEAIKILMALKVMNEEGYFSQTGVFVDVSDASEAVVAVRKNEKIE